MLLDDGLRRLDAGLGDAAGVDGAVFLALALGARLGAGARDSADGGFGDDGGAQGGDDVLGVLGLAFDGAFFDGSWENRGCQPAARGLLWGEGRYSGRRKGGWMSK